MTNEVTDSDGVQFIGTADVDVTALNQHDASEYRQELIRVIDYMPGVEIDIVGDKGAADLAFYKQKLVEVDAYLATFPEKI